MPPNKTNPPAQLNRSSRPSWNRFSIQAIMVITVVMAFTAAAVAHLWRASAGDISEVGAFILFTNVAPLGLMILVSWVYIWVGKPERSFLSWLKT